MKMKEMVDDDEKNITKKKNVVYIYNNLSVIGAGPGKLNLLSLNSLIKIFNSNIIFYDSIFNLNILKYSNSNSKKILIGKRFFQNSIFKKTIYKQLFIYYKKYKFISKLKSGDINIYGRLNNEILYYKNNKINYNLNIGISCYLILFNKFKISLTFRFNISNILLISYFNNFNILKLNSFFIDQTIIYYMVNNNFTYIISLLKFSKIIFYILIIENISFISENSYIFNIYDIDLSIIKNFLNFYNPKLLLISKLLKDINIRGLFIFLV